MVVQPSDFTRITFSNLSTAVKEILFHGDYLLYFPLILDSVSFKNDIDIQSVNCKSY